MVMRAIRSRFTEVPFKERLYKFRKEARDAAQRPPTDPPQDQAPPQDPEAPKYPEPPKA